MRSELPKVLHPLLDRPLLVHVLETAAGAGVKEAVVVVGHGAQEVQAAVGEVSNSLGDCEVRFALQAEQRGTGHAVQCALPQLEGVKGPVLILSGDVPCITEATLEALVSGCERSASTGAGLALVTFRPPSPDGYGRIVRNDDGDPVKIVEHRDADASQLAIEECNAGVYCVLADALRDALGGLTDDNAAGEIYLTDVVVHLAALGKVVAIEVDPFEVAGVNTPEQLAQLEAKLR